MVAPARKLERGRRRTMPRAGSSGPFCIGAGNLGQAGWATKSPNKAGLPAAEPQTQQCLAANVLRAVTLADHPSAI